MSNQIETDIIHSILPEIEAEGYEVYLHPNKILLPAFMTGYVPDAIGLRPGKSLAIEVARRSPQKEKTLEEISRLFEGRKDWELRVVWMTPAHEPQSLRVLPPEIMEKRIAEVEALVTDGHMEPALFLAWATLEALARALLPKHFERPQTPGRLVQSLAGEGYITPSEADALRKLAEKRNKLIHGELQIRVAKTEIERFLRVLRTLLKMISN